MSVVTVHAKPMGHYTADMKVHLVNPHPDTPTARIRHPSLDLVTVGALVKVVVRPVAGNVEHARTPTESSRHVRIAPSDAPIRSASRPINHVSTQHARDTAMDVLVAEQRRTFQSHGGIAKHFATSMRRTPYNHLAIGRTYTSP